jgi:TonB-linked SusC/RagA family outer membrane protein
MALTVSQLWAQTRTITGKVTDEKGAALAGASVSVANSTLRTVTNAEGNFVLANVPASARTLVISYVGYADFNAPISATSTTVNAGLTPASELEGVVVTGYGRTKRSTYSGSAARIDKKALELVPMASFDQILQGRTPGLLVTAGSGQPGSSARVQLRGSTSIEGGSDPLYVVDGMPVEPGVFQSINPNDFESVDVLKDAVAAALYGSRGAGGVIVATTKRGRSGKSVLNYRAQFGTTTTGTQQFEMMNSAELLQWQEMLGLVSLRDNPAGGGALAAGLPGWDNSKQNPTYAAASAAVQQQRDRNIDSLRAINTDWHDIFFRVGTFNSHDISLSGGSQQTRYYSSFGMYDEEGIADRSDLNRYTFRLNLDHTADKFNVSFSSGLGYTKRNFIESEGGVFLANPYAAVYLALPYHTLFRPDGKVNVGGGRTGANAYSRILDRESNSNQLKGNVAANFTYDFTKNIYAGAQAGVDFRETNGITVTKPGTYTAFVGGALTGPNPATPNDTSSSRGNYTETMTRWFQHQSRVFIGYKNVFKQKHNLNVTLNSEYIETREKNFGFTGYGLNPKLPPSPATLTPGTVTNQLIPVFSGGNSMNKLYAIFGIAKYTYNDKYTLDLTIRSDRHALLPLKNREQIFYGIGANWNILKETFTNNWKNINTLRLRASYGTSANAENFPFVAGGYYPTWAGGSYAGIPVLRESGVGNSDLDWEYTNQLNIGVDFGFFRDRLNGQLDVYNKVTKGLLISQNTPQETANGSILINAGSMRNRGVELALNYDVIRNRLLTWSIGGNLAYNDNEITDLGQVTEYVLGTSIVREGLPLGTHFINRWGGVDAATGSALYYTKDGKLTNAFDDGDAVADFGTYNAPFIGGFNTSVRIKGFELAAFFSFQSGFSRFNNQDFFQLNHAFALQGFNLRREMLTMWTMPGDVTDIQSPLTQREFSSKDIQDASYLRFRNLTASYTLPRSIIGKQKYISNVRIFGQAQNLHTWTKWTGFDPEDSNNIASYEYPLPRIYTFGVDVSF